MEMLCGWDDERKEEALEAIADVPARALLSRLLTSDPEARGTIVELLEDPFFNPNADSSMRDSLLTRINQVENTIVDKMDEVKKD